MSDKTIFRIIKGSSVSVGITILALFLFACLLTFTNIQENTIVPVVIVISAISILIGSTICTRKVNKNGMLQGAVVGFLYIFTIYLLSSITGSGFGLTLDSIIMIIASMLAGLVGGVIGVNMR